MSEYRIYFTQTASTVVTVHADNLDDAIEAAYNKLPSGLCHQCARETELAGDWEHDATAAAEDYPDEATP